MTERRDNVRVVERLLDGFMAQESSVVLTSFSDDCVWHVPGRNALAGDFIGQEEVFAMLRRLKRVLDVPVRFEIIRIRSMRDHVAVTQDAHVVVGGRSVTFRERLDFRVRDGRVVEVAEFQFDQREFDRVFGPQTTAV